MDNFCYMCDLMEDFPGFGLEDHCDHTDCPCSTMLHPFMELGVSSNE